MANISSINGNPIVPSSGTVGPSQVASGYALLTNAEKSGLTSATAQAQGAAEAMELTSGTLVPAWEVGTFDNNGGKSTNANYIRTGTPLPVSGGESVYVTAPDALRVYTWERDANGTVIKVNSYALGSFVLAVSASTRSIDVATRLHENPTPFPTPYAPSIVITTDGGRSLTYKGVLPAGSDLDNYSSESGIWYAIPADVANTPPHNNSGYVVVIAGYSATARAAQVFFSFSGDRHIRVLNGSTWSKWQNSVRGVGQQVNASNYQTLGITDALQLPDGITTFSLNVTDEMVANLPAYGVAQTVLSLTPLPNTDNASLMLCNTRDNRLFWGMGYSGAVTWSEVSAKTEAGTSELNLFCAYRRFGVIGDSFASGYVDINSGDQRDKSWVEHMRIITGATIYEFTAHGMSCERFLSGTFAPGYDINTLTDGEHDVPMLIVGLGLNDAAHNELGTIADFDITRGDNPNTYYGNFASMVYRIDTYYSGKGLELPYLFVCDIPYRTESALYPRQNEAIHAMVDSMAADRGSVSLVPLLESRQRYRELAVFQINAHYTAAAQRPMADLLLEHLNKVMLDNASEFNDLTHNPLNTYPEQ